MALNIKVALVVCIVFIGGMCWVVNTVAQPVLAMPAPAVVAKTNPAIGLVAMTEPRTPDKHLQYQSPLVPQTKRRYATLSDMPITVAPPARRNGPKLPRLAGKLEADPATANTLTRPEPPVVYEPAATPVAPIALAPAGVELIAVASEDPVVIEDVVVAQAPEAAPVVVIETIANEAPREAVVAGEVVLASATKPTPRNADPKEYVIQPNDTLGEIAHQFWGTSRVEAIELLVACNPQLADGNLIVVGDRLLIPTMDDAKLLRDQKLAKASQQVAATASPSRKSERLYTVRDRDTLFKIAAEQLNDGRRWIEIARLNKMKDADTIRPGTKLLLPARTDT